MPRVLPQYILRITSKSLYPGTPRACTPGAPQSIHLGPDTPLKLCSLTLAQKERPSRRSYRARGFGLFITYPRKSGTSIPTRRRKGVSAPPPSFVLLLEMSAWWSVKIQTRNRAPSRHCRDAEGLHGRTTTTVQDSECGLSTLLRTAGSVLSNA